MKTQLKILGGFAVGTLAGLVAGCQTYNFEPVQPLAIAQTTQTVTVIAKQLKPNMMIVVDKSGSMNKPIDPMNPACPAGCGVSGGTGPCPAGCPTRISDLKAAMDSFLTTDYTLARLGLMQLPKPGDPGCTPSALTDILVDVPAPSPTDDTSMGGAMNQQATKIDAQIQSIQALGGTPTAQTLGALVSYPPLLDSTRENFVLLLTDGEPNCNSANPNNCTTAACQCTFYTGVAPVPGSCPGQGCVCGAAVGQTNCVIGCLDQDAVVGSINSLRGQTIRTIPVGFGSETVVGGGGTGFAPQALNAMAVAGGFGRSCPNGTDAECNVGVDAGSVLTDTCDTAGGKLCADGTSFCCTRKYYVALNSSELVQALADISKSIGNGDPCTYALQDTPQNQSLLVVIINGVDTPATDSNGTNWIYTPPGANQLPTVQFKGALCTKLTSATPNNPVALEFRIVKSL